MYTRRFIIGALLLALFFGASALTMQAQNGGEAAADKTIEELQKRIEARNAEIQKLQNEAKKYQSLVTQKAKERKNLETQISYLEAEINELRAQIRITETNIRHTEEDLDTLNDSIESKEAEIADARDSIAVILEEVREFSAESLLSTLVRSPSLASFANEFQRITDLNQGIHTRLEHLKLLKQALEAEEQMTEEKKRVLEEAKGEYTVQQGLTSDRRGERQQLLTLTNKAKTEYEAALKDVEKRQREIQAEIVALEAALTRLLDPDKLPSPFKGLLAWPVSGRLTQGYGPTSETGFINDGYKFHNGIDLGVTSGTPLKAAADGVIKATGDNGKYAYGRWVAIDHGNGLTTLYGHLSRIGVSPAQKMKQGEVIGYSGSTGYSTGPHLHFTVYGTQTFRTEQRSYGLLPLGGSVNPFLYLP